MKKAEAFKESDELMSQERMFSLKDIKTQTHLERVDEGEMLSDIGEDGDKGGKENKVSGEGDDDDDDGEGDDDDGGEGDDDDGEGDDDDDDGEGDDGGEGDDDELHSESEKPEDEDSEGGMPVSSGEPGMCTLSRSHVQLYDKGFFSFQSIL